MKALRYYGHKDARLEVVDDPVPPPGWSIVEVEWASICGSDLKEYLGPAYLTAENGVSLPVTLGHEFAGRLVQTRTSRGGLQVGDRVAVEPVLRDGSCWFCVQGNYVLCDNLRMLGFDADGGFAELVAVPDYALHKLPVSVPAEAGALIEPLAVCVHAVRRGRVRNDETVVIMGAGMIGLGILAAALSAGAAAVYVVDRSPTRRQRAMSLGATSAVDPAAETVLDKVRADVTFDCVGIGQSANRAIKLSRKGGRVVLVGIFGAPPTVNLNEVVLRERELIGSFAYVDDFPKAIDLVASGQVPIDRLISDRIDLTDAVARGLEMLVAEPDKYVRILVRPQR